MLKGGSISPFMLKGVYKLAHFELKIGISYTPLSMLELNISTFKH